MLPIRRSFFLSGLDVSRFSTPQPLLRTGPCALNPPGWSTAVPVLFQIKPPQRLQSLSGTWLGHEVSFSFDAKSKTWFALAGVSLETAPGTYVA